MRRRRNLTFFLFLLSLCSMVGGCQRPSVGEIEVRPSARLVPGQSATVSIQVRGNPAPSKIQWTATSGKFSDPTKIETKFVAPPDPGPLDIECLITIDGKTTVRRQAIDVVASTERPPTADSSPPLRANSSAPTAVSSAPASGPYDIEKNGFVPSGWMGDGEKGTRHVALSQEGEVQKWTYKRGPVGWAAVAWQFPANNWGDAKGKDLSGRSFRSVTVRARGVADAQGRYPKIQFKAGGHTKPKAAFPASFEVDGEFVTLTADWKEYSLNLSGQDLSNVASAFVWVARASDHGPAGATFYLDRIRYE